MLSGSKASSFGPSHPTIRVTFSVLKMAQNEQILLILCLVFAGNELLINHVGELYEGGKFMLECIDNSETKNNLTWWRDDMLLVEGHDKILLIFNKLSLNDIGNYSCYSGMPSLMLSRTAEIVFNGK